MILLAFANLIQATDWYADTSKEDVVFALTLNDTGNIFGKFCFKENSSCVYLLGMRIACKSGNQYPVLVNSDVGSYSLSVYCFDEVKKGLFRYGFTNFNDINNIVHSASKIGFAFPMEGDQFKVIRFSLDGATRVIKIITDNANRRFFKKGGNRSEENL